MTTEHVDTLIVGGGQAGLVMSHALRRRGVPHLALERARLAERWRSERWDGLRFQFPNSEVRLPDFPFPHADPDGFAACAEIVGYLERYAAFVAAPLRCGVAVHRLGRDGDGFRAETAQGPVVARNVVVATGPFQRPAMPDLPAADCAVAQLPASAYRNPQALPPGAVLVAGAGASGAQIAEDLLDAGRRVFLSVGSHQRLPRRYRGRDVIWWLRALGLDRLTAEARPPPRPPFVISGAKGGRTIDFRAFAARGITLLGRIECAADGVLRIAPDLERNLALGDAACLRLLDAADAHVAAHGLGLPEEPGARAIPPDPDCVRAPIRRMDLRAAGIGAVIWATGYGYDFGWIDLPVLDARGAPVHRRGVTAVPGLYFLGLSWLHRMTSSFLSGVAEDADHLADRIAERS